MEDFVLPNWLAYTIVGVLVLIFLYWKFKDDIFFLFKNKESEGRITNWMAASEKGQKFFYPLIEFTTESGEVITYRADERCENAPLYSPGTVVRVKYQVNNPKKVKTIYPA
jgi:hypothetical protein